MPARKVPKKFIIKPSSRKVPGELGKVASLRQGSGLAKGKRGVSKRPLILAGKPRPAREKAVHASESRAGERYIIRKLQITRFYPDFSEIDDLLRFTAYLYLLALVPVLTYLIRNVNMAYLPDYAPPVFLADKSVGVKTAVAPSSAVLGEKTSEEEGVPKYPLWRVSYLDAKDTTKILFSDTFEAESLEYSFDASTLPPDTKSTKVVWETKFTADFSDLYNFYVSAPSTAKVFVDGELLVNKDQAALPSSSESKEISEGIHSLKVELEATPQTDSFQFLFY